MKIDAFLSGGHGLAPGGSAINRHRNVKKAAVAGMTVSSVGATAAQYATGQSALVLMAGGASATGFGLVIGGGVLTVSSSLLSGRSAYKTHKHIKGLRSLLSERQDCWQVSLVNGDMAVKNHAEHERIKAQILPYIISKKKAKRARKGFTILPGAGLLEGMRSLSKAGYKKLSGTKGKNRKAAASWLAYHFLTHQCDLSDAIIRELYSDDEMLWLKHQDFDIVRNFLMDKLKST